MKVIGGIHKGKKLLFIKEKDIRPTKDVVREAIFDVLRGWIVGKKIIDLFAGTGALGIEAISEGGEKVIFVESKGKIVDILKKNVINVGIEKQVSILKGGVEEKIKEMRNFKYDLVIADPPYDFPVNKLKEILETIISSEVINENGIIIVEHRTKYSIPESAKFIVYKNKKYGKTSVSYLKRKENEEYSSLSG
ncbi:MAG TPA: 16S rRNA (guanine(966)-N(2))-methyltransferase RsmD [bacterium]|mgnify:FL=1|nr:16S rRNA (guanine(966)-N(2))-methyltransferase RsmD [bacterium]